jgi:hypothetical protein
VSATLVDHEAGTLARLLVLLDLCVELVPQEMLEHATPRAGEWGHVDGAPQSGGAQSSRGAKHGMAWSGME